MKKILKLIFIVLLCSSFTLVDTPKQFKEAFNKLYPYVNDEDWSQAWNFYVATFTNNDFETKVWMNNQANLVMIVINLRTADQLPINVYNAFTFSEYSQMNVINVYEVVFSQFVNQYIILVNMDNSSTTYQLFYSPTGKLLNVRNVSYVPHDITPEIYNLHN